MRLLMCAPTSRTSVTASAVSVAFVFLLRYTLHSCFAWHAQFSFESRSSSLVLVSFSTSSLLLALCHCVRWSEKRAAPRTARDARLVSQIVAESEGSNVGSVRVNRPALLARSGWCRLLPAPPPPDPSMVATRRLTRLGHADGCAPMITFAPSFPDAR